jgi:hypothetical protein
VTAGSFWQSTKSGATIARRFEFARSAESIRHTGTCAYSPKIRGRAAAGAAPGRRDSGATGRTKLGGEDGDFSWALGRLESCPNSHNPNHVTLFRRISFKVLRTSWAKASDLEDNVLPPMRPSRSPGVPTRRQPRLLDRTHLVGQVLQSRPSPSSSHPDGTARCNFPGSRGRCGHTLSGIDEAGGPSCRRTSAPRSSAIVRGPCLPSERRPPWTSSAAPPAIAAG